MKNSSQKFAKTESDLNDNKSKNNTIQSAPFTLSELVVQNVKLLIKMNKLENQQYYKQLHVLQNIDLF